MSQSLTGPDTTQMVSGIVVSLTSSLLFSQLVGTLGIPQAQS